MDFPIDSIVTRLKANSVAEVFAHIKNICFDISMFHTYFNSHLINTDNSFRQKYSTIKAQWIKEKYPQKYTDNNFKDTPFVTVSQCFQNGKNFEYKEYADAWKSLSDFQPPNIVENNDIDSLMTQLKNHISFNVLPLKKIKKFYEQAPSGSYLLIRTEKKPKNSKHRVSILELIRLETLALNKIQIPKKRKRNNRKQNIKKTYWRNGLLNILPFSYHSRLKPYKSFLSIYKLIKA